MNSNRSCGIDFVGGFVPAALFNMTDKDICSAAHAKNTPILQCDANVFMAFSQQYEQQGQGQVEQQAAQPGKGRQPAKRSRPPMLKWRSQCD